MTLLYCCVGRICLYGSRGAFDYRSIGKREGDPVNILQDHTLQLVISEIVVVI